MLERTVKREGPPSDRTHKRTSVRRLAIALIGVTCVAIGSATVSAAAQKPVNNSAPYVVGEPLVGERLDCGVGSWSGAVMGFSYEWLRDAVPVASGVGVSTYFVTTADEGHSIWCVVTAIGSGGNTTAESANSIAIPGGNSGSPPENTVAPEVLGKPAVGETLTCSTGTWSGSPAPAFAYKWVRDEGAGETTIEGATLSKYKVVIADEGHALACKVTATNTEGTASKLSSNSLSVPGTKPENKVAPQVLGIEPSTAGESLTCAPGSWSETPAPTFTYRWVRDRGLPGEAVIEAAMSSTYTVEPADRLHSLSCKVIATDNAGSTEASSSNSVRVAGSKPENTVPPSVSGTPAVGETLTCEKGTWTGVPTPTYAYLWVRDQGLPGEVAIGAATARTYTARFEDRGHSVSCEVTATNSEGSAARSSEKVVIPAGSGGKRPENEVAPTLSGVAALGATLTCTEGKWSGEPAPALTYQWLRDGSEIPLAVAGTYIVVEADEGHALSCKVTAVNVEGVAAKASGNVVEIPGRGPEDLEAPIVSGTPAVGQQLTCLPGAWNGQPAPIFTYVWLRSGIPIPTATASTYIVAGEDRGESISCRVTAHNSAATMQVTSSNSLEIPGSPPQNTAAPEVSGTPIVGQQLTCLPGAWNGGPPPTYSYQWILNGISIPSATASTFTVTSADRGLVVSCKVTASSREGSESATSRGLRIPGARPEDVEAPHVTGNSSVGALLTCQRGIWNGQPPPAFTYQWLLDGTSIASATSSTHTVALAEVGHLLSCVVTATNSEGTTDAESSGFAIFRAGEGRSGSSVPSGNAAPTAAQILLTLGAQLTRAQHRARISSLRKVGLFTLSFTAPTAGKLEIVWYEAPIGARNAKPIVLAVSSTSFSGASTKLVKLRLTSTGRRLIMQSTRIKLTVKGVFVAPHAHPVIWSETAVLSH